MVIEAYLRLVFRHDRARPAGEDLDTTGRPLGRQVFERARPKEVAPPF